MKPYYQDDFVTLYHGDCRDMIADLPDTSVDAIITDPPYELGFMGKGWDRSGIAFDVDLWADMLRVAKPGAFLAAFGHSRTWHRLAAAVEDAGWEISDSIAWLNAEGYPKGKSRLKPAFEPIVIAKKPGAGGLNIDACMNETRWPSNALLDEWSASSLDAQEGNHPSGAIRPHVDRTDWSKAATNMGSGRPIRTYSADADEGPASRYFPIFKFAAKARGSERPVGADGTQHTTVKPLALMQWLIRLITPQGGLILEPFAGSGTTLEASVMEGTRVIASEQEAKYMPLILQRLERAAPPLFALDDPTEVTPPQVDDTPSLDTLPLWNLGGAA